MAVRQCSRPSSGIILKWGHSWKAESRATIVGFTKLILTNMKWKVFRAQQPDSSPVTKSALTPDDLGGPHKGHNHSEPFPVSREIRMI